jgi:hypothetical protein
VFIEEKSSAAHLASSKRAMIPAASGAAAEVPWKPSRHSPSISGTTFKPIEKRLIVDYFITKLS